MSSEPPFDGRCACGGVRYRVNARPMFVHCCHCRSCQRETGSAFALNAMVEAEHVELLEGEVARVDIPSDSGKGQQIVRCPTCQVAVWSHYGADREAVCFVRVGTLEDAAAMPPDIHIFTSSKQPWVVLPEGVPAVPEYYSAREQWPEESLARRTALRAGR